MCFVLVLSEYGFFVSEFTKLIFMQIVVLFASTKVKYPWFEKKYKFD